MSANPENIATREDLVKFIEILANESTSASKTWENEDLPSFLEAMAAWVEDMDGYYKNKVESVPTQPSWKTIEKGGQVKCALQNLNKSSNCRKLKIEMTPQTKNYVWPTEKYRAAQFS